MNRKEICPCAQGQNGQDGMVGAKGAKGELGPKVRFIIRLQRTCVYYK